MQEFLFHHPEASTNGGVPPGPPKLTSPTEQAAVAKAAREMADAASANHQPTLEAAVAKHQAAVPARETAEVCYQSYVNAMVAARQDSSKLFECLDKDRQGDVTLAELKHVEEDSAQAA